MGRCGSGLFRRLYHRKWLMLFSLKLQRDNRKNALTADPAKGETGKKLYFSPHCGDETTTYFNRAFPKGSAIACCFIPTSFGRLRQRWHCTADPAMSGSEMGGLLHNMVKAGLFLFSAGEPHGRGNLFFGGKSLTSGPDSVAGSANRHFSRGLLTRGLHSVAAERHYGYPIVILRKISTDYYGGIFWKRPLPLPGLSARIVREIRFCNENNIPAI